MATSFQHNQNITKWNNLSYEWKELIYLNYRLSKEDIAWRINTFLDDSFGLTYIFCEILDFQTGNSENDAVKFEKWLKKSISKLSQLEISELFTIKEILVREVTSLKPLEYFPNLRLVYLDHCQINEINILSNIDKLQFYETPEYPTNTPSLYYNSEEFNDNVKIIKNPFDEVQQYFSKLIND